MRRAISWLAVFVLAAGLSMVACYEQPEPAAEEPAPTEPEATTPPGAEEVDTAEKAAALAAELREKAASLVSEGAAEEELRSFQERLASLEKDWGAEELTAEDNEFLAEVERKAQDEAQPLTASGTGCDRDHEWCIDMCDLQDEICNQTPGMWRICMRKLAQCMGDCFDRYLKCEFGGPV